MESKQFHYILFRLFWDDTPVGFEYWSADMNTQNYTTGFPEKTDGWYGFGWSGVRISHNRKEILDIKYVDEKYLKEREERILMGKGIVQNLRSNQNIINSIRESNNLEPINIR